MSDLWDDGLGGGEAAERGDDDWDVEEDEDDEAEDGFDDPDDTDDTDADAEEK